MELKYREVMEQLLYHISVDIYDLTDEDDEDIIGAIGRLATKIEKLSNDVMYEDEIVYKRSGCVDLKFNIK